MFLEKLEIQGFKSFATKNILVFPGMLNKSRRGITGVVGPNGSGKSNIADSVRWALGEQSMKTLRGKKSEDIIFSGSDKKSRLGMAEVSLFLNNNEAAQGGSGKKAPIDYDQVIITRRLFRDGESEYLINSSRARLSDIQMLLAKANFGQKTYSVIGQGMVEGFLNTSLSERKEFFDEATGVKQFQIKRDESLNKLRVSYENLSQVDMLLKEIEPRVKSLTRQINKLKKREKIEGELRELQQAYYGEIWHKINGRFKEYNNKYLELEKKKREKDNKLRQINEEIGKMESRVFVGDSHEEYQEKIANLQGKRDSFVKQIARLEAQLEINFDSQGQFDLSWLRSKKTEYKADIEKFIQETKNLEVNIAHDRGQLEKLKRDKAKNDKRIEELNDDLLAIAEKNGKKEAGGTIFKLKSLLEKIVIIENENDLQVIKRQVREIREIIKEALLSAESNAEKANINDIQGNLVNFTTAKEKLITKINEYEFRITARTERTKLLAAERNKHEEELILIEQKLSRYENKAVDRGREREANNLKIKLDNIEKELIAAKEKFNALSRAEEEKTVKLFSLQKDSQNLQKEINEISFELNDFKVNSARLETKLEDLEIEIRQNLGSLRDIRKYKAGKPLNLEEVGKEISYLKRQLDLIGGIDPEVEKEYKETHERYDFLSSQVNDLSQAIDSLEKIIRKLDLTIKEKFDKEFKIISSKFEEYFKILFNGGAAKIIKVVEEEEGERAEAINESQSEEKKEQNVVLTSPGNEKPNDKETLNVKRINFLRKHNATGLAGVEIQATPPGKKIKSISMLSGGERALTAIALICAIISANPSPFVVLDEVDAALDEANSARLAKILDDLSYKTQFIIITHNRATMRQANVLYGVTMGNDGVSKLLSIKLEEAKKIK